MKQRQVVQWMWVAIAAGLLIAALIVTAMSSSGRTSTTGNASSTTAEPSPQPSRAWQCAQTARLTQERAAAQGWEQTVIWTTDQVGVLGQAEYEAYQAGVGAFNMELMYGSSDPDALEQAFLNGAYRTPGAYEKCAQYYGY